MTNDLEQAPRMAEAEIWPSYVSPFISSGFTVEAHNPESGDAWFTTSKPLHLDDLKTLTQKVEQAVLAKRDEELQAQRRANIDSVAWVNAAREEIEQLQARVAMQADLLFQLEYREHGYCIRYPSQEAVEQLLNARQADVDASMAKKKAEIEKGVLEEAALIFEGSTPFNWCAADGYANGQSVAAELRLLAGERGGVR